jgi:hypothetical protein
MTVEIVSTSVETFTTEPCSEVKTIESVVASQRETLAISRVLDGPDFRTIGTNDVVGNADFVIRDHQVTS